MELSRSSGGELKTLKAKVIFVLMDLHPESSPPPYTERSQPTQTQPVSTSPHPSAAAALSKRPRFSPFEPVQRHGTNW